MHGKLIAVATMAALLSTAAFAQNSNNNMQKATPPQNTNAQKSDTQKSNTTQTASAKGEWQASKLIHMNVYNEQNDKIGDIKELLMDKSGKIDTVAIGVGGFLGVGEHDVAVKFDQLKWVDVPVSSTTSQNSNTNRPATATTGTKTTETQASKDRNYPDHAVLNATKDQLKSMPQFDYNK
jgi:sporulation protein YlmC with PRC-barrel domain